MTEGEGVRGESYFSPPPSHPPRCWLSCADQVGSAVLRPHSDPCAALRAAAMPLPGAGRGRQAGRSRGVRTSVRPALLQKGVVF